MRLFCKENQIEYSVLLTAFHYLKIHLAKQLSNRGSFQSMQELYIIRVDAYVSLRLAMKMCDSRPDFLPKWWQQSESDNAV